MEEDRYHKKYLRYKRKYEKLLIESMIQRGGAEYVKNKINKLDKKYEDI